MKKITFTLAMIVMIATTSMAQQYDFSAQNGDVLLFYKIKDAVNMKVEVVCEVNEHGQPRYTTMPTGALVIPETVEYNDTQYTVTSIGNDAFSGCTGLNSSVTIPNSVKSIGSFAFYNANGFSNLTIGSGVETIALKAFINCGALTSVTILATVPPTVGADAFLRVNSAATVTVPAGSATATGYGTVGSEWQGMTIAEAASTALEQVQAAAFTQIGATIQFEQPTKVALYSANGAMLYNGTTTSYTLPSIGTYVVRTAEATHKVLVNE